MIYNYPLSNNWAFLYKILNSYFEKLFALTENGMLAETGSEDADCRLINQSDNGALKWVFEEFGYVAFY